MMKFNLKDFREKLGGDQPLAPRTTPGFSDVAIVKLGVKRLAFRDRVVFARKNQQVGAAITLADSGEKITIDLASKLKEFLFGSPSVPPPVEWTKQGFALHTQEQIFAYGLKMPNNEVKNVLMCFQAYFLKNLLFGKKFRAVKTREPDPRRKMRAAAAKMSLADEVNRLQKKGSTKITQVLRPNDKAQAEMIIASFAEILLRLADGVPAVFCLPGSDNCFEPTAHYGIDGTTEKLRLFYMANEGEARTTLGKYLPYLMEEKGVGLLCMLYSMLLSRNFDRLKKDMQDKADFPLVDTVGECSQALLNLVMFGIGTPYLHNGILSIEDENGEFYERLGIAGRSDVGFLVWDQSESKTASYNLGSRLKTPTMPIWLVKCNGKMGVLFNPNKELMKSYHAENRFQLYYYADHDFKKGLDKQETILTIDTRNKIGGGYHNDQDMDDMIEPPLESAIKTKWAGANVGWNEIVPYVW